MGNSWSSCFIVEKLAILIFLSSVTSRHDWVAPHCCFGQWHPRSVRSIMFLPFPKHPLASTNILKYTDRHRRSAVTVRLRAGKVGAGQPPAFQLQWWGSGSQMTFMDRSASCWWLETWWYWSWSLCAVTMVTNRGKIYNSVWIFSKYNPCDASIAASQPHPTLRWLPAANFNSPPLSAGGVCNCALCSANSCKAKAGSHKSYRTDGKSATQWFSFQGGEWDRYYLQSKLCNKVKRVLKNTRFPPCNTAPCTTVVDPAWSSNNAFKHFFLPPISVASTMLSFCWPSDAFRKLCELVQFYWSLRFASDAVSF